MAYPNGLTTAYTFDAKNRLAKIEYKDGATVKESYTYTLDDNGGILTLAQADGSAWVYGYDNRYRLTTAALRNTLASPTISANYTYAYDNADNLVTKVEPYIDTFNDGNYTGWTKTSPSTWSAETGYLTKTTSGWSAMYRPNTDPDMDVRFSYCDNDADTGSGQAFVRYVDWDNYIAVTIVGASMMLYKKVGGSLTTTTNSSATSAEGVWYDVRVVMNGQNISVLRSERGSGQEMTQVLSTSSAPVTTTARLQFVNGTNASFGWDNIMVVSDDMSTTSTYAYDDANELLTMSVAGTAQTFTYDDWGRTSTRTQSANSRQATYTYRFGDKLYLVNSNFFDEAASTSFVFDGLGKRRITGDGTIALKWYRWGFGWDMLAEYDSDGSGTKIGAQTREYFGQAEAVGTGAGAYTWRYYVKDHLGSTRAAYDANKASLGHYDYSPYGDAYLHTGADITHLYTGHDWAPRVGLYFAPYRFYNTAAARWISRDPAGMVDGPNLYGYVGGSPVEYLDPLGDSALPFDQVRSDFLQWFGGHRGDFLDCLGKCLERRKRCPPSGWSIPLWPVPKSFVRGLGLPVYGHGSPWTTIPSILRTYWLRWQWLRRLSKMSPYLTIADGAVSWAKIGHCAAGCATQR